MLSRIFSTRFDTANATIIGDECGKHENDGMLELLVNAQGFDL